MTNFPDILLVIMAAIFPEFLLVTLFTCFTSIYFAPKVILKNHVCELNSLPENRPFAPVGNGLSHRLANRGGQSGAKGPPFSPGCLRTGAKGCHVGAAQRAGWRPFSPGP